MMCDIDDKQPMQVHVVVLALPAKVSAARAAARVQHEGGVQGPSAFRVSQMMHSQISKAGPPTKAEGLASIMVCCPRCPLSVQAKQSKLSNTTHIHTDNAAAKAPDAKPQQHLTMPSVITACACMHHMHRPYTRL